jgi:hypothetical protein
MAPALNEPGACPFADARGAIVCVSAARRAKRMDIAMRRRRDGLLITESKKEYVERRKGLAAQIGPIGPVEDEYVDDLAYTGWETHRFRRIGAALLNNAFVEALENLLKQCLPREDFDTH